MRTDCITANSNNNDNNVVIAQTLGITLIDKSF